jgi:hypothetical protein
MNSDGARDNFAQADELRLRAARQGENKNVVGLVRHKHRDIFDTVTIYQP